MRNGLRNDGEEEEDYRPHLRRVRDIETAVPVLSNAAEALSKAGLVLKLISDRVGKIGKDTAYAISQTVELKKHLKAITDREQETQRRLNDIKAITDREQETQRRLNDIMSRLPKPRKRRQKAKR